MKIRWKVFQLTVMLVCLSLVSCINSGTKSKPSVRGSAGEVLIVMNDHLWNGACGDSIRSYLTEPVPVMPAPEPMFTLSHQNSLSSFMQRFRNIIIVSVGPALEKNGISSSKDVYASGQLVYYINAPSADSAVSYLRSNRNAVVTGFLTKDRDAVISDYRKNTVKSVMEKLNEKFHISIIIPQPYTLDVEKEDFVWIAREEGEKTWGLLMWEEPYTNRTQLEPDRLLSKMNLMTRKHVPGSGEGSYMASEPSIPPAVNIFSKTGIYSVQMNGLWRIENGYMGGPYVSHSIVDAGRGMIVTGMGFVYYPNRDKRQMIRQLEAILYTMMPAANTPATVAGAQ